MSNLQSEFHNLITDFKKNIENWSKREDLKLFIENLFKDENYPVENWILYNSNIDKIKSHEDIKYILIGDNPGKKEQLDINKAYLVGNSGVIAKNFFERNGLVKDFYQEVLILNKTPIHTAKTLQLRKLKDYSDFINETQTYMADLIFNLHKLLDCDLWITGYSELDKLFRPFKEKLLENYENDKLIEKMFIYKHFSMGSFSKDIKNNFIDSDINQTLFNIGKSHRERILKI